MADAKISALTGATTPLAGTEVLPIVQGSATVKVSVANLTAGRAVAMAGGSFTDNIAQAIAGKGTNFTANTPAAGMTSQLLNWYEEGIWTPNVAALIGTLTSYTSSGKYTRIGRVVTASGTVTITDVGTATLALTIAGYPFTASAGIGQASVTIATDQALSGLFAQVTIDVASTSGLLIQTLGTGQRWQWTIVYQM